MNRFEYYLEQINSDIKWLYPNFRLEIGEYFDNDYAQEIFNNHHIKFVKDDDLVDFLRKGSGQQFSKGDSKHINNFARQKNFKDKDEYNINYQQMQDDFKPHKLIALPMPIIIDFGDEKYLFAGNRRLNFAFNNGFNPICWVVQA